MDSKKIIEVSKSLELFKENMDFELDVRPVDPETHRLIEALTKQTYYALSSILDALSSN